MVSRETSLEIETEQTINLLVLLPQNQLLSITKKYKFYYYYFLNSSSRRRFCLYDKNFCICYTSKSVKHGRRASLFLMNTSTLFRDMHSCTPMLVGNMNLDNEDSRNQLLWKKWLYRLFFTGNTLWIRLRSPETARVIILIWKECLVNFSQGVVSSKINNFLLYLYSSE